MEKFISKFCVFCLLLLVLTGVLVGCSNKTSEVESLANSFLKAYFEIDYERAASMCTDSFSQRFLTTVKGIEVVPESVMTELKNKASAIEINITEIREVEKDRNTMTVLYTLTMPESGESATKSLTVKKVGDQWKIASL